MNKSPKPSRSKVMFLTTDIKERYTHPGRTISDAYARPILHTVEFSRGLSSGRIIRAPFRKIAGGKNGKLRQLNNPSGNDYIVT